MNQGTAQEVFTYNLSKLIQHAIISGFTARLKEVERTVYQHQQYILLGVSTTLDSLHIRSLAADIYFLKNDKLILDRSKLEKIGEFWESLHEKNRWGGNFISFTDTPHFEMNIDKK